VVKINSKNCNDDIDDISDALFTLKTLGIECLDVFSIGGTCPNCEATIVVPADDPICWVCGWSYKKELEEIKLSLEELEDTRETKDKKEEKDPSDLLRQALELDEDDGCEICKKCGNAFRVDLLKEGENWNDFGFRYCPFCGFSNCG
jgi:DNA-directed RNA polymerase subunit M/transcription elongation factor TFIIS